MSEPDNSLKKALGENGSFDAEKAEETRHKAVGTFEAAMKKVERYLRGYMCLCCWLIVFAGCQFFTATTTKGTLMNGLLVLVFFETIILMKLCYWTMTNKIAVLKEIKQLQLGRSSVDEADEPSPQSKGLKDTLRGLSGRERKIWWIALIAGSVLVAAVKSYDVPFGPASLTSRSCIALAADGSGSAATEMLVLLEGIEPTESFSFPAPKSAVVRFEDSHGRELPFTTSPQDGHVHYEVRLIDPVPPGHQFSYTQFAEDPNCATEKDGIWTYMNDDTYGFATNELSAEIALPEGAEIVSATPWPVDRFTMNNRPIVRFEAKRGRNEAFKYTVQYRLPTEPAGQAAKE